MGLFQSISNLFPTSKESLSQSCSELERSLGYRKLALEVTIDLVANSVARADWRESVKGKFEKTPTTYLLNNRPNPVETASEFFKHWTKRLMLDGEALVIDDNGSLYVAESYTVNRKSRNTVVYENVLIDGDTKTISAVASENAIYVRYNQDNIRTFMNTYLNDYEKLIESSQSSYRTNKTRRFVLESSMFQGQTEGKQKEINDLFTSQLKDWASTDAPASVYGKSSQWDISDMSDKQIESAKDSRDLIRDVFGIVATTYHVPLQMIMGHLTGATITQNIIDNYLVGIVLPIIDLFEESFSNYNYTYYETTKGYAIKADTTKLRLTDLKTIGTFITQVMPTGALTLNDVVVKYLQLDPLPDDIGNMRLITKNYATIETFQNGNIDEFDKDINDEETEKQNLNSEDEDNE